MTTIHEKTTFFRHPSENTKPKGIGKCVPVMCQETGVVYNSLTECAKANHLCYQYLTTRVKKGKPMSDGKTYTYLTIAPEITERSTIEMLKETIVMLQAQNAALLEQQQKQNILVNQILANIK